MLRLIKFIWILCWSFSIFAWLSQWVNFCFCFLFLIFCFKDNIWDRCRFLTALLFLLLNFLFFIFNLILLVFNIWLFSIVLFITTYKVTKNIFDFICYFLCLWLLLLNFIIDLFKFDKRDGSIASCCIINNKICTGSWFNRQVKSWYEGISLKGPTLLPSSFPNIPIDWSQLRDLLARTSRYSKAYSVDCIDSMPFKIVKLVEECCAENICSEHRIWIDRLLFIFSKEFWSLQ